MSGSFSVKGAIEQVITHLGAGSLTLEVARRLFSPDCVIRQAPSLPFGGEYRGPEGFLSLQEAMRSAWRNFGGELVGFWSHDNPDGSAMVLAQIHGEAAQGPFQMLMAEYWRFSGGLVSEVVPLYWDTNRLSALSKV